MQSFYLGGAGKQASVLGGFEPAILATAFNVSQLIRLNILHQPTRMTLRLY
jgi:hypothetical protein